MLGRYINFRASQTAANKGLGKKQVMEICNDIWLQIETLVGSSIVHIIMVLLKTDPKNYPLDVVLYPLFQKAHEIVLRKQYLCQPFPKTIRIIVTVLFYKHWLQMCTRQSDTEKHRTFARNAINANFVCFERLDPESKRQMDELLRINDRFYQAYLYKHKIW